MADARPAVPGPLEAELEAALIVARSQLERLRLALARAAYLAGEGAATRA